MGQQLFVPLTDDLMYDTPEMITSGLRPYRVDTPCYHWQLCIEESGLDSRESNDCSFDGFANGDAGQPRGQNAASGRSQPNVIPFPQELAA